MKASVTFNFAVNPAPSFSPPLPPLTTDVGASVSVQCSANLTGGSPPFAWSGVNLPPGTSIDPVSGLITGTPTTAGTYSVTVTADDGK